MSDLNVIILAAGKGTRMQSDLPKVLHKVLDKPIIFHVLEAVLRLKPAKTCIVIGHMANQVKDTINDAFTAPLAYALQAEQRGTGHAVSVALPFVDEGALYTLIMIGDAPLITTESLSKLIDSTASHSAAIGVLTFKQETPFGYGRIVRSSNGELNKIVEEKEASEDERKITECNSGIYVVKTSLLRELIDKVMATSTTHEYYLTDIIELARHESKKVVGCKANDDNETMGINDKQQLETAEQVLKQRR